MSGGKARTVVTVVTERLKAYLRCLRRLAPLDITTRRIEYIPKKSKSFFSGISRLIRFEDEHDDEHENESFIAAWLTPRS